MIQGDLYAAGTASAGSVKLVWPGGTADVIVDRVQADPDYMTIDLVVDTTHYENQYRELAKRELAKSEMFRQIYSKPASMKTTPRKDTNMSTVNGITREQLQTAYDLLGNVAAANTGGSGYVQYGKVVRLYEEPRAVMVDEVTGKEEFVPLSTLRALSQAEQEEYAVNKRRQLAEHAEAKAAAAITELHNILGGAQEEELTELDEKLKRAIIALSEQIVTRESDA